MRCSISAGNKEPRDDYAELLCVALAAVSKGDFIPEESISLHCMVHITVPRDRIA